MLTQPSNNHSSLNKITIDRRTNNRTTIIADRITTITTITGPNRIGAIIKDLISIRFSDKLLQLGGINSSQFFAGGD